MADPDRPLINEHEFEDFQGIIRSAPSDKERQRRIRTTKASYTFNTKHIVTLLGGDDLWDDSHGKVDMVVNLYEAVIDKDNMEDVVKCFKFKDEQEEIRERVKQA